MDEINGEKKIDTFHRDILYNYIYTYGTRVWYGITRFCIMYVCMYVFYVTNRILPIKEALHTVNRYSYHYLIYN